MRELKRITTNPKVKNGLPCIRDTGITVSEIVRQVVHEKPTHEVLADYPSLESDDIEEALAYAVNEMSQAIHTTSFDMRAPITSIQGFSQLFLTMTESGEMAHEQGIPFVQSISKSGLRLQKMLQNLVNWNRSVYGAIFHIPARGIPISEVLHLANISSNPNFQISIVEDLPLIKENHTLFIAFSGLGHDDFFGRFKSEANISITHAVETKISVQIKRQFANEINSPMNSLEGMFYPTSPISTATLILQEYESELQICPVEDGVIFEFELPVWTGTA